MGHKARNSPSQTPLFQKLTNDDLRALAKETGHSGIREYFLETADFGLEDYSGQFLVHDGDLRIDGDFDTGDRDLTALVVRGNLRVSGLYQDTCNDGPSQVIVFGDLCAANVLTAGYLEVTGDLVVNEAVVGDYNDGGALVHGALRAALFLPFDHAFAIKGDNRAKETIHNLNAKTRPRQLAKRFYAAAEDSGTFRLLAGACNALEADLGAGRSILASGEQKLRKLDASLAATSALSTTRVKAQHADAVLAVDDISEIVQNRRKQRKSVDPAVLAAEYDCEGVRLDDVQDLMDDSSRAPMVARRIAGRSFNVTEQRVKQILKGSDD